MRAGGACRRHVPKPAARDLLTRHPCAYPSSPWLRATAAGSPLGSVAPADARIDEILATLRRLESRVDQICEGVPVC
jgi:hypothetical protein